ncbi:protein phosphatase 1 regulatory subunit 37, partial [Tremellales sp. Uapishka_1]
MEATGGADETPAVQETHIPASTTLPSYTQSAQLPTSTPKQLASRPSPAALDDEVAPTTASPAIRRPKPPTKGILKPPPPPARPTLGNKLRDMVMGSVNVVGGSAKSLFDPADPDPAGYRTIAAATSPAASSSSTSGSVSAAVGGTLNAISGRFGLGLGRFSSAISQNGLNTPPTSPLPPKSVPLPDQQVITPISEKSRQKQPLRRATFVLPALSITYPISSLGAPWSGKVEEDRKRIESSHRSLLSTTTGPEYWTSQRLVTLYESACRGREERPRIGVVRALETLSQPPKPRHVHLILVSFDTLPSLQPQSTQPPSQPHPHSLEAPFNRHTAEAFADVLSAEWGLSELNLENGVLDSEEALKPILHALLISGTLSSLSLAGNRKMRSAGWKLVASFVKRARSLRYINLSDTTWDRKSIESLTQAVSQTHGLSPVSSISPPVENGHALGDPNYGCVVPAAPLLKEDDETLPASLQTLRMDGCGLKGAVLEALGEIGPLGAVALAIMIRDYPDSVQSSLSTLSPTPPTVPADYPSSPSPVPYAARKKPLPTEAPLPPIPLVVTSSTGGITSRTLPEGYKPPLPPKIDNGIVTTTNAEGKLSMVDLGGASMALQRSVRALDGVERIGRLLTLDLKGNEIKSGVGYIAQVLKRNRTLKVLNLCDNRIESSGLAAIAEALIAALRTTFTVNTSLKRLFLAETGLTTEGAISLAEFLPETKTLLHLDLTSNPGVETAGILALSVGLRANTLIRCLDLSIPPNNSDLAELSQSILQSCIRNTETAVGANGIKNQDAIWGPIKKSALVRQVKEADELRAERSREETVRSPEGVAREYVYTLRPERVLVVSEETARDLGKWFDAGRLAASKGHHAWEPGQLPRDDFVPLLERAKALRERLVDQVQETADSTQLERLLSLNDLLTSQIDQSTTFTPPARLLLPSQIVPLMNSPLRINPTFSGVASPSTPNRLPQTRRHMRIPSSEISSPNFSIGDSDNDSDAEEVDVARIAAPRQISRPLIGILLDGEEREKAMSRAEKEIERSLEEGMMDVNSPVDKASRAWVEEEGEIFRKGTKLGVADEEEVEEKEDVSGEELRKETEVARSPTRRTIPVEEEGEQEAEREDQGKDDMTI